MSQNARSLRDTYVTATRVTGYKREEDSGAWVSLEPQCEEHGIDVYSYPQSGVCANQECVLTRCAY